MNDDPILDSAGEADRLHALEARVNLLAALACERDASLQRDIEAGLRADEEEARRLYPVGQSTSFRNLRQSVLVELAARRV